jgi:hypothetical protein
LQDDNQPLDPDIAPLVPGYDPNNPNAAINDQRDALAQYERRQQINQDAAIAQRLQDDNQPLDPDIDRYVQDQLPQYLQDQNAQRDALAEHQRRQQINQDAQIAQQLQDDNQPPNPDIDRHLQNLDPETAATLEYITNDLLDQHPNLDAALDAQLDALAGFQRAPQQANQGAQLPQNLDPDELLQRLQEVDPETAASARYILQDMHDQNPNNPDAALEAQLDALAGYELARQQANQDAQNLHNQHPNNPDAALNAQHNAPAQHEHRLQPANQDAGPRNLDELRQRRIDNLEARLEQERNHGLQRHGRGQDDNGPELGMEM